MALAGARRRIRPPRRMPSFDYRGVGRPIQCAPGDFARAAATVAHKRSFAYMNQHEEGFEMSPPTPFSGEGSFLKSGRGDRGGDVGRAEREPFLAFCRDRLRGGAYPAARFYPQLGG